MSPAVSEKSKILSANNLVSVGTMFILLAAWTTGYGEFKDMVHRFERTQERQQEALVNWIDVFRALNPTLSIPPFRSEKPPDKR